MSISDYADLMVASGEYAGRDDLPHLFSRFVGMAETKLNRMLRVGEMDASATIAVVDGDGTLPADFLEMRDARIGSTYPPLRSMPLQSLKSRYISAGIPEAYAVSGNTIMVRPSWTGDLLIDYYQKIPALTPASPTNWLLSIAPNAYLYAVVEQVALFERDVQKVQAAGAMLLSEVMAMQDADNTKRFGNMRLVIGGCTP